MPVLSRLHLQGPWEVSGWALYRDGADGVAGPEERKRAFLHRASTCKGPGRRESLQQEDWNCVILWIH